MFLTQMVDQFRESPLTRTLEIEDCWLTARDIRLAIGPFGWLDLLVLVENHGAGRSLVRVGHRWQPATLSIVAALAMVAGTSLSVRGVMLPWTAAIGLFGVLVAGAALWRSTRSLSVVTHVITELAREAEMQPLSDAIGAVVFAPAPPRRGRHAGHRSTRGH